MDNLVSAAMEGFCRRIGFFISLDDDNMFFPRYDGL
jgi:hypothetical protein